MIIHKTVAVLLHTTGAAVLAYAWFNLDSIPNNRWIVKQRGGHLQYLTIQGCVSCSPHSNIYVNLFYQLDLVL